MSVDPPGAASAVSYAETGITWFELVTLRGSERDADGAKLLSGLDRDQLARLAQVGADIALTWLFNWTRALGHDPEVFSAYVVKDMRRRLEHAVTTAGGCDCEPCEFLRRAQQVHDSGTVPTPTEDP